MKTLLITTMPIFSTLFGKGHADDPPPRAPIVTEPLSSEDDSPEPFFRIDRGKAPWGDYGSILIHGLTAHLPRKGAQFQLERTGPFIPPITFPGICDILVSTQMRDAMRKAGFRGIEFRSVIKAHITEVNWHTWNLSAGEPKYYPEEGEPEGYILDKEHSEDASRKMGEVWEVVVSPGAALERIEVPQSEWGVEFRYKPGTRNDADLFSTSENKCKYCSLRAKLWFERHFSEWTSFEPVSR